MFFSKIQLRRVASRSEAFWDAGDEIYDAHRALWSFFGDHPDRERDFIYRTETSRGLPLFYIVSAREPDVDGALWKAQTKPYDPKLSEGQVLAFSVCVNPTIRRSIHHGGDGKRHDVVMDAKVRLREEGVPKEKWPSEDELVQDACKEWLMKRADTHGFDLQEQSFRADAHIQRTFQKPRNKRQVQLTSVNLTGILEVRDVERLREVLFDGLGPAKAYGFGLMMVRPV